MEQRYLSAVCDFYVGRLSMECDLVPSHVSLHVFVSGSSGLQVSLFVKSFVLYYDRCIVGMDYATTTGTTRWWIYLSYGPLPKYKGKSPANRINSLRTKPGFVRIQFYEEVYEALLQVLPKHQKVCLQSAYNLHCRDEQ